MAAPLTVEDAMVDCRVGTTIIFNGMNKAERVAADIFDDDFQTCLWKSETELEDDFKSYAALPVQNGQLRLNPRQKKNIRAFLQWTKDEIRLGRDPSATPFPVGDANDLLKRAKAHKAYLDKAKTLTDAATPQQFTDKTRWEEWSPSFLSFLRTIPGRNGVPLSYVLRDDPVIPRAHYADFLDEYIDNAPLTGVEFVADSSEVHTYIVKFIAGNETAEAKVLPHSNQLNGRLTYRALRDHYEGIGINAIDIIKAETTLNTLTYLGEKKPYMYWEKFEKELNNAFNVFDRREGRQVYSDDMKLRKLVSKINVDFLSQTKAAINVELTKTPVTMTYDSALTAFRNQVNQKYPLNFGRNTGQRRINQLGTRGRGRGRGRNGRGRGGRGNGRFGQNGGRKTTGHPHARMVQGEDGTYIEVHPSYSFQPQVWQNIPQAEKRRLQSERQEYKRSRTGTHTTDRTTISGITTDQTQVTGNDNTTEGNNTHLPHSIMGGRNEQANLRSRNPGRT